MNRRPPHRPELPLHPRLTVAHVPVARRKPLIDALVERAPGTGVLELDRGRGLIDAEVVRTRAEAVAGRRADAVAAELALAEAELEGALHARDDRALERDEIARRRDGLLAEAVWCDEIVAEADALLGAVGNAQRDAEARRADLRAAQQQLDRALEQRAAAIAALEEAEAQLAALDTAGMDEPGVRRELEAAGREAHEATLALEAARDLVADLEHRYAAAAERLEQLDGEATALATELAAARVDTSGVVAALGEHERSRAFAGEVDARALALAAHLREVDEELRVLRGDLPDAPTEEEVAAVERHVRSLETEIDALRAAAPRLTPEERAEIDAAHDAVLAAEDRLDGRFGRDSAQRELDAARTAEAALLERHGFAAHLDVVLTGGRKRAGDRLAVVEQQHAEAVRRLSAMRAAAGGAGGTAALRETRDELLAVAREILGVDPGDRAVALLEQHVVVPEGAQRELATALMAVGREVVGESLPDAARRFLGEHEHAAAIAEEQGRGLVSVNEERAHINLELERLADELTVARALIPDAEARAAAARRTIAGFEGELRSRAGEVDSRLERLAVAEQLRAQVTAVEATLARAEREARLAVDAAMAAASTADAAWDRAEAAVADALRRGQQQAAGLRSGTRPVIGPELPAGFAELATGLRAQASRVQVEVDAAERAVANATVAAGSVATRAAQLREEGRHGATSRDVVDAAVELLGERRDGELAVVDDLTGELPEEECVRLLDEVVAVAHRAPVLILTEDADLLSWAIALPSEVGAVTTADALATALDAHDDLSSRARASGAR